MANTISTFDYSGMDPIKAMVLKGMGASLRGVRLHGPETPARVPPKFEGMTPAEIFAAVKVADEATKAEVWQALYFSKARPDRSSPHFERGKLDGQWILTRITTSDTMVISSGDRSKLVLPTHKPDYEKVNQDWLAGYLEALGFEVQQNFECPAGRIDITTGCRIFEVKPELTRRKMYEAMGQVLIYRAAIDQRPLPFIVGRRSSESASVVKFVNANGVGVIFYGEEITCL